MKTTEVHCVNTRRLLKIGLFSNILEWYEFSIYGSLAGILGILFFEGSPTLTLIKSFSLFAASYLARPLGSFFFGYFADQYGRGKSLRTSLLMMSVPTILIGALPTYQDIGYLATVLLFILKLIQGFAAGGEFPISACYIFEEASPKARSMLCGVVSNSSVIGSMLALALVSVLFWYLEHDTITAWGWRIPFLLGIPITLWVAYIRKDIVDSIGDDHRKGITEYAKPINPISILLTSEKYPFLKALCLVAFSSVVGVYVLSVWMPFYLMNFLKYPPTVAYPMDTAMTFSGILFSLIAAYLARFIGFQPIIKASVLLTLLLAYPLFLATRGAPLPTLLAVQLGLQLLLGGIGGVIIEALGTLFPHARATGMSIAFTLPTAVFGGFTPLILTYMTDKAGLMFPAFYIMAFALLALPAALSLKTAKPISAMPPQAESA